MIFASDLDRTLIYSSRFLEAYKGTTTIVEQLDGRAISHMATGAVQLLTEIHQRMLFVPTTTRSHEQFQRISLFQQSLRTKYAVVANGGMILRNNEPDPVWQEHIRQSMDRILSPQQLIDQNPQFFQNADIKLSKACDGLFAYAVFHERQDKPAAFEALAKSCASEGYSAVLNGRKAYFIPSFMTKWEALRYIVELEGEQLVVTAGDSILDEPMLSNAEYGIIPLHGELIDMLGVSLAEHEKLRKTSTEGLEASNELLAYVLELSCTQA